MRDKRLTVVVEGALMVALAFGLSFIKIYSAPYGGSVTLGSMIPIMLYAARRGVGPGLAAGAAHGLLQLVVEPVIYHPVQVILDYPLAFGFLGLAGLFKERVAFGVTVGVAGRFVSHYLSGVIFFASSAQGNPYVYSALYNGGYLVPELIVSVLIIRFGLYKAVEAARV
ncbi:MAG: energy-coupled thiamine transporter ThiT [Bacillota bacterium]|jgi:thiamine transporter